MKFGNASWGFRETPLEKQLEITKEMGLSVLELGIANAPMDLPLDVTNDKLDEVKALYNKYGIELLTAATGNDFTNGNKDDVEKVKKVTDICSYLGVKILRIFAGFSPVDEVVGERWSNMIECLTECAEYADKKGVTLTVETHGGVNGFDDGVEHFNSTSSKPDVLYKMMSELPQSIKVNFDPANLNTVGVKNPEEVYNILKDRVAAVHLKDFAVLPSGHLKPSACGDGDIDWKAVMDALSDFEGPVMFEYENVEDIKEGSLRCLNYIKNIIKGE